MRVAAGAPNLAEVLRGSLRRRFVRCGKTGCHCRKGRGHGPFLYLSVSLGVGRTAQITIPGDLELPARRYVANFARASQILEVISTINRELFRQRALSPGRAGARPPPKRKGGR